MCKRFFPDFRSGSYRKNRTFCRMSSRAGTANQEPTAGEPALSGQGRGRSVAAAQGREIFHVGRAERLLSRSRRRAPTSGTTSLPCAATQAIAVCAT